MSAGGAAAELGGRVGGGIIGGIIGSFIPPPGLGTLLGRAIGSRLGGMAARAAVAALEDHVSSMEKAEEEAEETDRAEGVAAEEEACKECAQRCKDAAGKVKDALYRNKRSPQNGSGGHHGYLNRMIEQMCGRSGPGSRGWRNHIPDLRGAQNRLRDAFESFAGDNPSCNPQEHFSRAERQAIDNILNGNSGWSPQTIPWKGPGHQDCQTLPQARKNGRIGDYLNVIRPPQGNPGAPLS